MGSPRTDTTVAKLYRQAAKVVEKNDGPSCCAVTNLVSCSTPPVNCEEAKRYTHVFADAMCGQDGYGFMVLALPDNEQQNFRVLALCFAAAMVEAGDA